MGTLVVILLGEGCNAAVSLKKSKAEASGWIVIATGWAFAVFCGIVTAIACGSPGAHLNPAVTVAIAVKTGNFHDLGPFIVAQLLGAFAGAMLVWLFYYPHWKVTEDQGTKLGVFCTAPAIRSPLSNLFCEALATALLIVVIGALGAKTFAAAGPAPGLAPYLVAILVWSIGLSLGGTTRLRHQPGPRSRPPHRPRHPPIAGKGGSDWGYAPIPVVGPIIGAALAGLFLRLTGI